ncbi:MAG: phytanoyl-CoA dioxygenase family protein [Actinomycetota bacterium]
MATPHTSRSTEATAPLTEAQLADYRRDGLLVLRGAIDDADITRWEEALARNPPLDGTLDPAAPTWPDPGRYTLALNAAKDPDLADLAQHQTITSAAADALGAPPRLTAFVLYDRTPGGAGIPSHNDYKRWRPVGSSMNWLFTIVPFCDFDAEAGRLLVAPGSHHLERVSDGPERPQCVAPPVRPAESDYVDPDLRRGDLLLMNMHLWHRADGNRSDHHRIGAFNKYAAADAPPATGYFLFDDDVHAALAPANRELLAVHSDYPIATTRLLLMRGRDDPRFLVVDGEPDGSANAGLPGGPAVVERAIPDWDVGNYIASLAAAVRDRLAIELPWVSYIGDFTEGDHLSRVYAYTLTGQGFPVPYPNARWLDRTELVDHADRLAVDWIPDAVDRWLDHTVVRGKGLTQAQSRVDQYAY